MKFFQDTSQAVSGSVLLLPQDGAPHIDLEGRPLNSWAIKLRGYTILVDAPFSWSLDGTALLSDEGRPPWALLMTDEVVAIHADAMVDICEGYTAVPFLRQREEMSGEARSAELLAGVTFREPQGDEMLARAGLEIVPMVERGPTSSMIWSMIDGILLTGDAAVGPAPRGRRRVVERPRHDEEDDDARLAERWREVLKALDPQALLPLRGRSLERRDGETPSGFRSILSRLWQVGPEPRRPVPPLRGSETTARMRTQRPH